MRDHQSRLQARANQRVTGIKIDVNTSGQGLKTPALVSRKFRVTGERWIAKAVQKQPLNLNLMPEIRWDRLEIMTLGVAKAFSKTLTTLSKDEAARVTRR
jgi:hypothetical protein